MSIKRFMKTLSDPFRFSEIKRKMKLKLSEDWSVLEGFDGGFYLLNEKSGEWMEIGLQDGRALRLCDGESTVEETLDILSHERPEQHRKVLNDTLSLFKKCRRLGLLK